MAKELQNITLGSVGFYGLNTELSPVELPPEFARVANNAIIDKFGRLGSRKGFSTQTSSATALNSNPVKRIFEWNSTGTSVLFAVGNNKIFRVDTTTTTNDTLTEMTLPVGYSITGDDWSFEDFNGEGYFFQAGHEPLLVNTTLNATDSLDTLDNQSPDTTPAAPEGNIVSAAYGRLWASGVTTAPETVYWSDLLIGDSWEIGAQGSSSGLIDLAEVWPTGYDEVTGIEFHNGRLIIFGKESILIYSGAEDPTTMFLEDSIAGTGCIARDSIQHTGDDIVFLSPTGVRLLSRTLEQSSLPLGEVSANVRTDVIALTETETTGINSVFSPEENFYLLIYEGSGVIWCFDWKTRLPNADVKHTDPYGSRKVTKWPNTLFNCAMRADDGTLYVGGTPGVGLYSGYQDDGASYDYEYLGPAMTFGVPANLKILKRIRPITIGTSSTTATLKWGYGYSGAFKTRNFTLDATGGTSEWGVAEFGIDEYSASVGVADNSLNTTGTGTEVTIGLTTTIDGSAFSLQQVSVQAIIGKLV